MRELIVETKNLNGDAGKGRYVYSILVDEMDVGRFFCESYGVSIRDAVTGQRAACLLYTSPSPRD